MAPTVDTKPSATTALSQLAPEPAFATAVRGLFVAGAVLMPLCCFAAACHQRMRHAFALPVLALLAGSVTLVHLVAQRA